MRQSRERYVFSGENVVEGRLGGHFSNVAASHSLTLRGTVFRIAPTGAPPFSESGGRRGAYETPNIDPRVYRRNSREKPLHYRMGHAAKQGVGWPHRPAAAAGFNYCRHPNFFFIFGFLSGFSGSVSKPPFHPKEGSSPLATWAANS